MKRGKPPRIRYHVKVNYKPACPTYVVEATFKGTRDEMIVIGAHHDTQGVPGFPQTMQSPGACDNASGVAALLKLARHLTKEGTVHTIKFCTFGGEERNLLGSREYVRMMQESGELALVVAYLNFDQSANGINLNLRCSPAFHGSRPFDVQAIGWHILKQRSYDSTYPVRVSAPPIPSSDHWLFHIAGVPILHCSWSPVHPECYQRSKDNISYCRRDDKYQASVSVLYDALRILDDKETQT